MATSDYPIKLYQIHIVSTTGELHTFSSFSAGEPEIKARAWLEAYAITEELETTHLFDMKEFCHDYDMLYFEGVGRIARDTLPDAQVHAAAHEITKRQLKRDSQSDWLNYDTLLAACKESLKEAIGDNPVPDMPDFEDLGYTNIAADTCEYLNFSDMARIAEGKQVILMLIQAVSPARNTPTECLRWAIVMQLNFDLEPFLAEIAPETD